MQTTQLVQLVPEALWVSEGPVWFGGVRLRARSTVIRLENGHLLVHSPSAPTPDLVRALRSLGEVDWLVVPNCFHHLHAAAMAAHFPSAKVVGPRSALLRNPSLRLHSELQDPAFLRAVPELSAQLLEGCPFLDETVFFHHPTGTLLGADLVLSASAEDHWTWRWAGKLTGCFNRVSVPPDVRVKTKPNLATARVLDRLAALPVKRILVAHAAPIEALPMEQLLEAWRFVRSS